MMAVTDRHKLVFSPNDPPWLFDLERDPDEITNFFEHPGYREIVQQLATQLHAYGQQHGDRHQPEEDGHLRSSLPIDRPPSPAYLTKARFGATEDSSIP